MVSLIRGSLIFCALSGFAAVALAAIGAHAVADEAAQALIEKASFYQLIHTVVLVWLTDKKGKAAVIGRLGFMVGMICFCGSLYLRSFGVIANAPLAPFGGTMLMIGWLSLAFLPASQS